ncbi:MAG TPA: phosphoribosylformylglycinamidine synthase [Bacteroidales bacterium]|nr:phosphoribosylformylglycinamidine synthase [Bacteroidales bacterium]HPF03632.1 phosphoribosylformylglycinamidine synthase [Bacteroidales bacterium]HPJ58333.1 phosphoribosylformylglycinamidine synthase [Bacteroidales bacterium]HPR10861.1 phosphoribosylformylglycinamidine synthase [Bacteroidales bacterium]HRW84179.1 phosphoribosylformylglycinamidine synthase [Bacteroidales bacterium]
MIFFFKTASENIIAAGADRNLSAKDYEKLNWLFGNARSLAKTSITGRFIGPRKEMITPWSTNAVEITQNMGIRGIARIEEFFPATETTHHDPMLQSLYEGLDQNLFTVDREPEPVIMIDDISEYNEKEGLALNTEEIAYLEDLSQKIGRKLTDSEVFGFSQVNSEHCRHKIFNGTFIIDGKEQPYSLFEIIKNTTLRHPNKVVSAYKDNCAFIQGPSAEQFAPATQDKPDYFNVRTFESVLSLKAETHNFPTTVEPFNGASTGTGGEIRDRIAGGKGAFPVAGTAVYMTSYPRPDNGRPWELNTDARPWLYQTPEDILIKASNGASDFGNKFGQPLICGSLLTFEHFENDRNYGFDKVIMLAGGIGSGKKKDSAKSVPVKGDLIVLLGGDNYRIGMGGGAVSSVDTGKFDSAIELNAVQRANPEMQKRVYNAIRALCEMESNPVISIHDHGAGGHLNCLSELVEATGGSIDISKLPVGDPTLSSKELIGNESQERMGLVLNSASVKKLRQIAERERAPIYVVGNITGDHQFTFLNPVTEEKPIDLKLEALFGKPPRTIMTDKSIPVKWEKVEYSQDRIHDYISMVLQLEEVACKDWLTNKVDRSVTGRIARQQCAGPLQLPLNNLGAIALDYRGKAGMATSLGHAPAAGLIDPEAGSVLAIAEALTNIIWAPLTHRLRGVSLSANWMWPCRNPGEDARLYKAVKAAGDFATALGINIPTGKDSLSMTQKYPGQVVFAPGTVIITAAAEVSDIRKIVEPVIVNDPYSSIIYIDMSRDDKKPGGSSFAQVLNRLGNSSPTVKDPEYFAEVFNTVQHLIIKEKILAGHDISAGGLFTALLEMCFSNTSGGLTINLSGLNDIDTVKLLFSQNPGILIQVKEEAEVAEILLENGISYLALGHPINERKLFIRNEDYNGVFDIDDLRDTWFRSSYLLDRKQSGEGMAKARFNNYIRHELKYELKDFKGTFRSLGISPSRRRKSGTGAAIIREKGVNGDREMAYALYLAGFDVKDVHMTDLITERETLDDVSMIVFVGGFSNSDVLGSAKGWAGAFRFNPRANKALERFYRRKDTLSLGVCNGCQLMAELGLIYPRHKKMPGLLHNSSEKFESAFLGVKITESNSVMLGDLEGMELGIWVAHGEGRFSLPYDEKRYNITMKYSSHTYPANPNGSDYDVAGLCSDDGRHLAVMPHLERAFFPWQCGWYPSERRSDEITPWMKAFVNARKWIEGKKVKSVR